tara:strand:+ start:2487 stop:3071 length:585 start_codon:yes stop_codon:yes gene_type:complete
MFLKNYYYYYTKLFSSKFCDYVIQTGNSLQDQQAEIGGDLNSQEKGSKNLKTRNSNVVWIENKDILYPIMKVMQEANKASGWNFNLDLNLDLKAQFTKYAKGQHYDWHCDSSASNRNRKLSFTLNLSDPDTYKGGDFEFNYKDDTKNKRIEKLKVAKEKGSCIIFPSFLYHRVTPVKKGIRYSLVVWLMGDNWR